MTTIAWIGLGNMGSHMSSHLAAAGHSVIGFDINPAAMETARSRGVKTASSVSEAVSEAEVVFTMLPKGTHVRSVVEEVWEAANPGTLIIDSSTIDQATSIELHRESSQRGFQFVDAPVSGGVSGAENATLAIMTGGAEEAVEAAEPYLQPLSSRLFRAGGPGMGLAAKIANNMMLMISMMASAEGSQLADSLGLDPQVFWDIVSASSGNSWSHQTWYPVPGIVDSAAANRNFEPGFTALLALKDVSLAVEAGKAKNLNLPAANLASKQLKELVDSGLAEKDCTLIAKFVNPDGSLKGWTE
ncbi:prephenate dehydrogenase/arogenate dehydrogenase family protein [Corynebacterium poyangense]|uniref:Prephenate dehydrogenase/arogenate dehydrogenase family protein n=1 Tax=Corynebacterium poyangense TaxID=2684405 RepID=A0A7H0SQ49_9CORY|nr:NAD(P)-dependent oxidoreductase [Corynebacterium poyangense]MBZ8178389.1 prephenate dehydrogenase/arogenate dehydrogenase family protein [Corynebacterium poyangense]QNQ90674.1 prephenate dehydrogenase/arogenate dehydrogenase family protein [Corynebacterium poyangense]